MSDQVRACPLSCAWRSAILLLHGVGGHTVSSCCNCCLIVQEAAATVKDCVIVAEGDAAWKHALTAELASIEEFRWEGNTACSCAAAGAACQLDTQLLSPLLMPENGVRRTGSACSTKCYRSQLRVYRPLARCWRLQLSMCPPSQAKAAWPR